MSVSSVVWITVRVTKTEANARGPSVFPSPRKTLPGRVAGLLLDPGQRRFGRGGVDGSTSLAPIARARSRMRTRRPDRSLIPNDSLPTSAM